MSPLATGIEIMVMGMATVFAFLALLVGVIRLISVLVQRFAPELAPVPATTSAALPPAAGLTVITASPRQLTAIRAAVAQYRARHK